MTASTLDKTGENRPRPTKLGTRELGPSNSSDTGGYLVRIRNAYGESASPPAILTLHVKVEISLSSGVINLKWTDSDVVLEETDSLNGSWTRVSGATSPFSPAMSGPRRFYRLRPAGGP
jgi:hypothetical protein